MPTVTLVAIDSVHVANQLGGTNLLTHLQQQHVQTNLKD